MDSDGEEQSAEPRVLCAKSLASSRGDRGVWEIGSMKSSENRMRPVDLCAKGGHLSAFGCRMSMSFSIESMRSVKAVTGSCESLR
jgi:hypothetical protein